VSAGRSYAPGPTAREGRAACGARRAARDSNSDSDAWGATPTARGARRERTSHRAARAHVARRAARGRARAHLTRAAGTGRVARPRASVPRHRHKNAHVSISSLEAMLREACAKSKPKSSLNLKKCPPGNTDARQGIQRAFRRLGVGRPKIRPCIPWRASVFPGGHNFRRKTHVFSWALFFPAEIDCTGSRERGTPGLCRPRLEAMLREACAESKIHSGLNLKNARQGIQMPAREYRCPPGNTEGIPTVGGGPAQNPALYSLAGICIPWRA
jgi:hypothetical protein